MQRLGLAQQPLRIDLHQGQHLRTFHVRELPFLLPMQQGGELSILARCHLEPGLGQHFIV
jgi:hypothetical protein